MANVNEESIRELCVACTRNEQGRHFTEWMNHWELLEANGLIEVHRPVHDATGIPYGQDHWRLSITEDGQALVDANPELHPS